MKFKSLPQKIEIDWNIWTKERIAEEMVQDGKIAPVSEELRNVLFSMTEEEVKEYVPKRCWYMVGVIKGDKSMVKRSYKVKPNPDRSASRKQGHETSRELKDLSKKVREMLANEDITKALLKDTPKYVKAAVRDGDPQPADVIVCVLIAKSFQGDIRAIEQLRKMGYGEKVTLEAGDSFFNKERLQLDIVDPNPHPNIMEGEVVEEPVLSPSIAPAPTPTSQPGTQLRDAGEQREGVFLGGDKPKIVITKDKPKEG